MMKLTNPDKILYPKDKITKGKIAEYYVKITPWILPYIINRPLTLVRCPSGIDDCFYQKHITETSPSSLQSVTIKEKEGKGEYIYIKDIAGLLALPQLGVLEIHPWGSRINKIEYPDMIIFDLDPAPDVSWKEVVAGAFRIKNYLKEYKLKSFVKTTGGKGLHVYVPIKPEYTWEEVKNFSHVFVDLIVAQHPKEYLSQMTKAKRTAKIFLDYLRNARGAHAVAAYSTRARPGAPVSTPLDWDELTNNIKDTAYTVKNIMQRMDNLKKDPWRDFFKIKQSLRLKS